jgi:TolB-like protein/DNA-binding winged helix-turn-helix (wHTH) protein
MIGQAENLDLSPIGLEGTVQLRLLGPFRLVLAGGQELAITTKKNRALLAIVALSPGGQATRDKLCELLWGDRRDEQARSSLRQSLAVMRKELGQAEALLLQTRDDIISLKTQGVSVDVISFIRLTKSSDLSSLQKASELYSGELLSDTSVKVPAFEDWLAAERRNLEAKAIAALEKLVELETGQNQVTTAKRLVDLDPLRESSHRMLMMAYSTTGENGLALRQYDICQKLLKTELGVDPGLQTQELKSRLAAVPIKLSENAIVPAIDSSATKSIQRLSIAVLPFSNLSNDREQQYLADGLTEDLIIDLSKIPDCFIIAAQTIFKYRGTNEEPTKAAHELGVRYVVQGSIRRVIDRLRISAQLIDTVSGGVIWGDRFDRNFNEVYDLQTELADKITFAINGPQRLIKQAERYKSPSLEAFDLCMQGRQSWRISDEFGVKAIPLFERAIELDPHYPEAYRWLAMSHNFSWILFGSNIHPARELAIQYAEKAVELDPLDSSSHFVLAVILTYDRRWDEANAAYGVALSLNPNNADAWADISDLRTFEGKGREAIVASEKAFQLNPSPSAYYYLLLGQAQFAAGEYENAIKTLRNEVTYRTESRRFLAGALAMIGKLGEARAEGRLFAASNPQFTISHWVEVQPFRDLKTRDRFVEGFRLAGLPE